MGSVLMVLQPSKESHKFCWLSQHHCASCAAAFFTILNEKTFNTTAKTVLRKYDRQFDCDHQFNIVTSCSPDGVDRLLVCHCLLIIITLVSVRVIAKWYSAFVKLVFTRTWLSYYCLPRRNEWRNRRWAKRSHYIQFALSLQMYIYFVISSSQNSDSMY